MTNRELILIAATGILALCFLWGVDDGIRKREQDKRLASYCHSAGHSETLCAR